MNLNKNFFKRHHDLVYLGLLTLVALLGTLYMQRTHGLYAWSDWSFHVSRVEEIYQNLKSGHPFTYIASRTFSKTGAGSFLFYPYFFFYPWALLRFVLAPVNAFYGWYLLITLMAVYISYFSMKRFSGKSLPSLLFTLLYVFTPYRIYLGTAVFGEFIAAGFLPLVFLGYYEILFGNRKKWYYLAIGGALVAYAHILSIMLVLEFCLIIFIIKLVLDHKLEKERLFSLLLSGGVCFSLILPIVVPFVTDFLGQGVSAAKPGISYSLGFFQLILSSFGFGRGWKLSFYLLAFLATGWLWLKGKKDWIIYGLGIASFIFATTILPWSFLSKTILGEVQLTARYLSYCGLFVSVLLAKYLSLAIAKVPGQKRQAVIYLLPLAGLLTFSASMYLQVEAMKSYTPLASVSPSKIVKLPQRTVRNEDYNKVFNYQVVYGAYDYYPEAARTSQKRLKSIARHYAYLNGKKQKLNPTSGANRLTYHVKLAKNSTVNLPALAYQHTAVTVNGKKVSYQKSKRGTVLVHLSSGSNTITVSYQPASLYFWAIGVSALAWLSLILFIYRNKLYFKAP
ncbi:hypothetical protein [Lactobacillus sp.]|uniref:hypothetical protein n=1 Tax=Lactobacillus sp. TaxID=1591 RepID=UPI003EF4FC81